MKTCCCLCGGGDIGDEDTSLVERAEQRADRFEDYSDSRASDAQAARAGVEAIAGNIPFGQPILVGHHSERRARKHADKIENGMRRAVSMWETADYWKSRAAGALNHADYKALPAVRARRIKGLEADKRKQTSYRDDAQNCLAFWSREDLTLEQAINFAACSTSTLRVFLPRITTCALYHALRGSLLLGLRRVPAAFLVYVKTTHY